MAEAVYVLCAFASIACAFLLWRAYRAHKTQLLFWSGLCFAGLALNNVVLFVDLVVVPTIDLSPLRTALMLLSMMVLVYGLIWEAR